MKHPYQSSGLLYLFLLITITPCAFAQPQSIRFQHLSIGEKLSANQVMGVTQDKHGFIWVATADGLNRFDGYNVEVFRHKQSDKNSLPSSSLLCIFTDSRGIVWIGTSNGLAYFDDRTNSFRTFSNKPNDKNSLVWNLINVINEDRRGILWVGTPRGLCSFDVKSGRFQRFLHSDDDTNSISHNAVQDIKFAPDGNMWITTNRGLNRLDLSTMKFRSFFHDPADPSTLPGNDLNKMVIDEGGNLWTHLSNKLSLVCFNTKTYRCKQYKDLFEKLSPVATNYLLSVFIDKKGRLWAGTTQSGLLRLLPDRNSYYEYKTDRLDPNSLQSNFIINMFQDRSGMIWLGTLSAGAERFNPDEAKFIHYPLHSDQSRSFESKSVQAFAEDSLNRLWVGTSDGLSILDRNTGIFTNYYWNQHDSNALSVNFIRSICRDRQGNMWVGTQYGLNLFDPAQKNFQAFYAEKNNHSLASNIVSSIICDSKGDLIINSKQNGGVTIYHSKTRRFTNFKKDSAHALLNLQIEVVFEDNRGLLWIATRNNGLVRYDREAGKMENFTKSQNDSTSLPANHIGSITQDHKGLIWIGTSAGLCRFNENARTFTTFDEDNGLPNVRVKQLLVDDKDRIWMGTNRGISMLNESRTAFTNYDPSDGLQGWEFSEPSAFKTHDGYFCYGGNNGFNMFHPDSIKKNPYKPPITLKRITIFDQPLKTDSSYSFLKSLRLSYKQDFFSFEFAALNYDHPEKNQYACQLIGFDKKVIQLGTNRVISYTNVPHGNYTLKVTASNNDGIWNETGYELKLVIIPPFWVTWWFRTIVIAVFLGAVFLFFKLRENRIKKEQARQTAINKQIAGIRMIALRAQMNPHFVFNSLNSIQHFITTQEKEEALSYLSKFSKLIRKILENSRENTVSINNELQLLELYIQLEQLRFSKKFDYHLSIDEKIDMENTEIPPLLIQPYIENAILHGLINKDDKGDLWLSLVKNNGSIVCKIEDNGIGRARAQEIEQKKDLRHKALGIKVTEERILTLSTLLNYKIEVVVEDLFEPQDSSEERMRSSGTRVTITIPVNEEV